MQNTKFPNFDFPIWFKSFVLNLSLIEYDQTTIPQTEIESGNLMLDEMLNDFWHQHHQHHQYHQPYGDEKPCWSCQCAPRLQAFNAFMVLLYKDDIIKSSEVLDFFLDNRQINNNEIAIKNVENFLQNLQIPYIINDNGQSKNDL